VKAFENGKRHKPEEIIGQLEAGKNLAAYAVMVIH